MMEDLVSRTNCLEEWKVMMKHLYSLLGYSLMTSHTKGNGVNNNDKRLKFVIACNLCKNGEKVSITKVFCVTSIRDVPQN